MLEYCKFYLYLYDKNDINIFRYIFKNVKVICMLFVFIVFIGYNCDNKCD